MARLKQQVLQKYIQNIISKLKARNRELSTRDAFKANPQQRRPPKHAFKANPQQDQQRDAAKANLYQQH
jgi:hypothetical protein